MAYANPPAKAGANGPVSAEEMLVCLRQVIAVAEQLTRRFSARIPGMDDHPLTPFALHAIGQAGRRGLPQVDVARALGMSPSSATRLIDSLEGHGVVRREPHPNDRRINQVVLTATGHALMAQLLADLGRDSEQAAVPDRSTFEDFRAQLSRICTIAP